MRIVVDANVLIAAFLKSSLTRELLLDERLELVTPEYGLLETRKALEQPRVLRRLRLGRVEFDELWTILTSRIGVLPEAAYRPAIREALRLAPHAEDAPYLALALHSRLPLWSNDAGLQQQPTIRIYTTQELLDVLALS